MLMELLIPSLNSFSEMPIRKPSSKPKIPKFCIIHSFFQPKYQACQHTIFFPSIRLWYAERWSYLSYMNLKSFFEVIRAKKKSTSLALKPCGWDFPSSTTMIQRTKSYNQRTYWKLGKMWKMYTIIKIYYVDYLIQIYQSPLWWSVS